MVEPAVGIGGDGQAVAREQLHDAPRQRGVAGRGIAHREQFVGKAAEVVDRRRRG